MKTSQGNIDGNADVAPLYARDDVAKMMGAARFKLDTFTATRRRYLAVIQPVRGKLLKELRVTVEAVSIAQARIDVDAIIAQVWPGLKIGAMTLAPLMVADPGPISYGRKFK